MRLKCGVMKRILAACFFVLSASWAIAYDQSSPVQSAARTVNPQPPERLAADTPKATTLGNAFVAPKDWSIGVKGPATILEAPEGGSWIALVDVQAKGPEEALAAAWQAYKPEAKWPVKVSNDLPNQDGWSRRHYYDYLTSPNEKR